MAQDIGCSSTVVVNALAHAGLLEPPSRRPMMVTRAWPDAFAGFSAAQALVHEPEVFLPLTDQLFGLEPCPGSPGS